NTGNVSLSNISMDDTLPDGTSGTLVYSTGDDDSDSEIDPGEQWIYTSTYTVTQSDIDAGGELVNTVVLTTDEINDPIEDKENIPIVQLADIVTQKNTVNNNLVGYVPGESVEYSIVVQNNGPSTAKDVMITDTAPEGTS